MCAWGEWGGDPLRPDRYGPRKGGAIGVTPAARESIRPYLKSPRARPSDHRNIGVLKSALSAAKLGP